MDKDLDRSGSNRAPDQDRCRQRIERTPDDTTRLPCFNQVSDSLGRNLIDSVEPRSDVAVALSELK